MTSPNPTSSEIDALVLAKVKEVVPEYSQCVHDGEYCFATKECFNSEHYRPIQLADILRAIPKGPRKDSLITQVQDDGFYKIVFYSQGEWHVILWNLSLDYAQQEYATRLSIYQLIT